MVGFILDKLVRDRMPSKFRERKIKYRLQKLTDHEFEQQIIKKLYEEADELITSTTPLEKATEAADLLEALDSACLFYGLDLNQVYNQHDLIDISPDELYRLLTDFKTDPSSKAGALIQGIYSISYPISKVQIEERRAFKASVDGAFTKRVYMIAVDVPEDSPWLARFQDEPQKYPRCDFIGDGDSIDWF